METNKALAVAAVGAVAAAYCCLTREQDEMGLEDVGVGESMGAGGGLKLKLVGSGGGDADQMAAAIPDDAVTFTILRQNFGAASHKFVFIQMVGKGVGIVKKGRAVARKDEVIEALGIEPHLEINAEEVAACSSATIDAALHEKFADDGLQGFSSAGAKHAAEDAIAKARAESKDKFMPLSETLKRIADPEGDINWVAISADKDPFPTDEGAGSIDEMRRAFQSSTVCAAMLRLQFKTPGAMLTKYVYIWWTPDSGEIGMVQRGKLNALQGQVEDTVKKHCTVTCSIEATDSDETSVHAIIEKVKSAITASEEEKAAMTVDNFHAALQDQGGGGSEIGGSAEVGAAVAAVANGSATWATVQLK